MGFAAELVKIRVPTLAGKEIGTRGATRGGAIEARSAKSAQPHYL